MIQKKKKVAKIGKKERGEGKEGGRRGRERDRQREERESVCVRVHLCVHTC